ncbi:MAG: AAA family ATPase [Tychonema bourrellyi B0820]|uniref:ATP-binding protein n=1 Tax=Tychonema bourrellyi FEM_GT703 TaxID=2040638 RepID=A0A2G4EWZ1_9CYAN|nr:AAA family ATPase [Tychonema bourrellyi]MDQ2099761.1 AAA family ATPase [Tychonema bourrellyi B0820]PHX53960.1 ATP-binding protein [Tychonema bourrellyi FEM_GT703]
MHLLRVQVPDFRGLKDIDITFEKDFFPKIFPLGSQNGGGKSTLLQLIFILLHCSVDEDKQEFLQNLLQGFKVYDGEEKRVLAIIDIWDGEKVVEIEFFCYKDSFFKELLTSDSKEETIHEAHLSFSILAKLKLLQNNISVLEVENSFIENKQFNSVFTRNEQVIAKFYQECRQIEARCQNVIEYLESKNMTYICNYSSNRNLHDKQDEALLYHFNNLDIDMKKANYFLWELSYKIFLAAPSTQIFLFLAPASRKLLFGNSSNGDNNYYAILESARSELNGLFTYDFLAVELLIESFKAARDRDFKEAIKTGDYGNSYQALINELNLLVGNKRINVNEDLAGVNFKLDNNGETIELYPEDLSHGELKRLSIYIWLKSRNIEDAIVLMDEVEIAFHPDWQYQIISDLQEWAPSNQYILATHSYALCEALTPAHVKEIEPKLIKQESNITNES